MIEGTNRWICYYRVCFLKAMVLCGTLVSPLPSRLIVYENNKKTKLTSHTSNFLRNETTRAPFTNME